MPTATACRATPRRPCAGSGWPPTRLRGRAGQPGVGYTSGIGVAQDTGEALRWFRLAADQALPVAQHHLGLAYANGSGVAEDDAEALRWFRLAADQGHAAAQHNLAIAHANGLGGMPLDAAEAVRWFRLAADQGHAAAQGNLGIAYSNGLGVDRDAVEACAGSGSPRSAVTRRPGSR